MSILGANIERASEDLISSLIEIGALYHDEDGTLHASPEGVYGTNIKCIKGEQE